MTEANIERFQQKLNQLKENLNSVIQGKSECIDMITIALLAGGSVLMEDVPGVGKTTLAKALARSIDADFNRIQFTPDLLPADILGSSIYNPADGSFTFHAGPIFCNVLLADEINRASPRTQSALLEAMSEMQVTIEGKCRELSVPFFVLATQNSVEFHGTYPLPEAQLDRFLILLNIGYPAANIETEILYSQAQQHPVDALKPVLCQQDIADLQTLTRAVKVDKSIAEYIVAIIHATRTDTRLKLGASPRGSLMLFRACQASAVAAGRDHVLPDDVQRLAGPVLAHRLVLTSKTRYAGTTKDNIVQETVRSLAVPV